MPEPNDQANQAFPFLAGEDTGGDTASGGSGGGGDSFEDPLNDADASPAPKRKRINEGAVLLAAVLLVAAGVLLVMRQTGSARTTGGASSVEIQVEKALAQMTGGRVDENGNLKLPSTEAVVALFADDPASKQVGLNELKFNPFALRVTTRIQRTDTDGGESQQENVADRRAQQAAERRSKQLRQELKDLELQTVMNGQSPMALISGQVVREQAQLGSFTVTAIEPMAVVLTAGDNSYRLTMKQPGAEAR